MSNTTEFDNISFDLPKNQSNVIKVIGVGGGGSNAINHMFKQGIKGVDFVICNTDSQALENSPVPNKIQLGVSLTEGLGAGANPKVGEQSAIESLEEIQSMLSTNTKMVFVTAGMGGGTGTGAAPIIAQMAKDMDILTVGIVTIPFQFEGKTRNAQAQEGVEKLRKSVDSLIVINNNKLREVYGNLGFKAGFSKADEVLATAARGIAEVITHHYTQNIDLRDAKTVLSSSGTAIMGSASASGSTRAKDAITKALDSPLLNDNKIRGAKNVLLLIVSGSDEITLDEIGEISDHIQDEAGHSANIIMGVGEDESLDGAVSITVIATGFNVEQQNDIVNTETKKIIHTLEDEQKVEQPLYNNPLSQQRFVAHPEPQKPIVETPAVVRHTLFDEETPAEKQVPSFDGFVATTDFLKSLSVAFEEVGIDNLDTYTPVDVNAIDVNEFVIVESTTTEVTPVVEKEEFVEPKREQQMLSFDFPINGPQASSSTSPRETTQKSPEAYHEIEVHEPVEIAPKQMATDSEIKRYNLDDYEEVEDRLSNAQPMTEKEDGFVFETRTVATPDVEEIENDDANPFNSPISQILRDRTEERKRMMKQFNHRFNNPHAHSHLDKIEKQPAYKRMGVELEDHDANSGLSRTSVNTNDGNDIELRQNNSFLHDNVD